jgi:hypothetical protein
MTIFARRIWLRQPTEVRRDILIPGRCHRLLLVFNNGDMLRTWTLWAVHNFDISETTFHPVAMLVRADVVAAVADSATSTFRPEENEGMAQTPRFRSTPSPTADPWRRPSPASRTPSSS